MALNDSKNKFYRKNINESLTILGSAVRTATTTSSDIENKHNIGAHVIIDMTVVPGVETVTFALQGLDETSGEYYTIITSAALVATGTVILKIYPGITTAANLSVSDILPLKFRVVATHSASGNFTYSIGVNII